MEKWKTRIIWREPDSPELEPLKTLRTQRNYPPWNKDPHSRVAKVGVGTEEEPGVHSKDPQRSRCVSTEETLPEQLELG